MTAATRSAVPSSSRARSTPTSGGCSSSGARNSRAEAIPWPNVWRGCRPRLERAGDFSQTVDSSGNLFPYIKDYTTGLPCSAANTSGCFADGGVLGKIPANRIYQPGLNALKIYPQCEHVARQRPQLRKPAADGKPAARRHDPHGLPGDELVAGHRPVQQQERQRGAAVRNDVGGCRQRPARYARYPVRDAGPRTG